MNKLIAIALLYGAAAIFNHAQAASNGDTHTTSLTTCAYGGSTCSTTITTMVYINGKWVVESVKTVITQRNPTTKER